MKKQSLTLFLPLAWVISFALLLIGSVNSVQVYSGEAPEPSSSVSDPMPSPEACENKLQPVGQVLSASINVENRIKFLEEHLDHLMAQCIGVLEQNGRLNIDIYSEIMMEYRNNLENWFIQYATNSASYASEALTASDRFYKVIDANKKEAERKIEDRSSWGKMYLKTEEELIRLHKSREKVSEILKGNDFPTAFINTDARYRNLIIMINNFNLNEKNTTKDQGSLYESLEKTAKDFSESLSTEAALWNRHFAGQMENARFPLVGATDMSYSIFERLTIINQYIQVISTDWPHAPTLINLFSNTIGATYFNFLNSLQTQFKAPEKFIVPWISSIYGTDSETPMDMDETPTKEKHALSINEMILEVTLYTRTNDLPNYVAMRKVQRDWKELQDNENTERLQDVHSLVQKTIETYYYIGNSSLRLYFVNSLIAQNKIPVATQMEIDQADARIVNQANAPTDAQPKEKSSGILLAEVGLCLLNRIVYQAKDNSPNRCKDFETHKEEEDFDEIRKNMIGTTSRNLDILSKTETRLSYTKAFAGIKYYYGIMMIPPKKLPKWLVAETLLTLESEVFSQLYKDLFIGESVLFLARYGLIALKLNMLGPLALGAYEKTHERVEFFRKEIPELNKMSCKDWINSATKANSDQVRKDELLKVSSSGSQIIGHILAKPENGASIYQKTYSNYFYPNYSEAQLTKDMGILSKCR